MKSYQINDLERLTGIKAHTIRIWEKRYGLIKPNRTDTNRRYYDDEQVRRLLNVTTLLSYGHKISKIAEFTDDEIYARIENETPGGLSTHVFTGYVNDLVASMLAYDEHGFEKIFSAAVLRMGLYETMLYVIYPFLHKIGVLWSISKAAPVQEHFATCLVRRKLMAVVDSLLPREKRAEKFLLFLPPDEWHDIGLLFANYMIRRAGFDTVYLGQNVPQENIANIANAINPDFMLTLFTASRPINETKSLVESFAMSNGGKPLLFSGAPDALEGIGKLPANVKLLAGVSGLEEVLADI